jgi:hypothetical protein
LKNTREYGKRDSEAVKIKDKMVKKEIFDREKRLKMEA